MRTRKASVFILLAGVLAVVPAAALAGEDQEKEGQYDVTGTWYAENNAGGKLFCTIFPAGNSPQRFVVLCDSSDPLPFYPNRSFVAGSFWMGELERTGVNTYRFMQVAMFRDVDGSTPHIGYVNGDSVQVDQDTFVTRFRSANYPPGQTPWEDGTMHSCSPWIGMGVEWFVVEMTRVPIGEPCEPTPFPLP
jgi:hypothetical protein